VSIETPERIKVFNNKVFRSKFSAELGDSTDANAGVMLCNAGFNEHPVILFADMQFKPRGC